MQANDVECLVAPSSAELLAGGAFDFVTDWSRVLLIFILAEDSFCTLSLFLISDSV